MVSVKALAVVLLCVAVLAKVETVDDVRKRWEKDGKPKPPKHTDYFCSTCLNIVNEMNFWLEDIKDVTENVAVAVLHTKIPDAMQEYVKTPHPNKGGGYLLMKALPDMGNAGIVLGGPEIANFTEIIKSKYQLQLVKAAVAQEDHKTTKTNVCKRLAKVCTDIQDLPKVMKDRREQIMKNRTVLKEHTFDEPVEMVGSDSEVRGALRRAGLAKSKKAEDKYIKDYKLYQKAKEKEKAFHKKHAKIVDKFLHSDRAKKMSRKERDAVVEQYAKDKAAALKKWEERTHERRKRTDELMDKAKEDGSVDPEEDVVVNEDGSKQKTDDADPKAAKAKKEHYAKKEKKEKKAAKRKVKNEL